MLNTHWNNKEIKQKMKYHLQLLKKPSDLEKKMFTEASK